MILVYNLGGLVVGGAGVLVGAFVVTLTRNVGAGVLWIALVWLVAGFGWRRWKLPPGEQPRRYPSIYFIPLPLLAIFLVPLAFLIFLVEGSESHRRMGPDGKTDPRIVSFEDDERSLGLTPMGGDAALSEKLAAGLTRWVGKDTEAGGFHVFTRVNPGSVLVLVKAPKLKGYTQELRAQLPSAIAAGVSEEEELKAKQVYIGIKGSLTFGAIQTPPGQIQTGTVLHEDSLYGFYGPSATAATVPSTTETSAEPPMPAASASAPPAEAVPAEEAPVQ